MKSEDKSNISDHLNEYDFKKLKIKFLDKDEIKIFLHYVKMVYFPLMKLFIIRVIKY